MADNFSRQLVEAIGNATSETLRGNEEMVTKWVSIIEVMDADGGRSLYTLTNDGAKAWDILGMLQYGMERSQAVAVREENGGNW